MAKKGCVLILAATIVALALRLPRLEQRPMHGDEAVHAIKFEELLERGVYEYDPEEYHGPTLNYLTLIPAKLTGAENLAQVTEFTLRIVPVFFGVCLVLLLLLVIDGLGIAAAVYAAILTAVSAAMVFYSRYYIQEMLLVFFTFGAIVSGYRYAQSRKIAWALLTGALLGLMHSTKETCIIVFGAMFLAVLLTLITKGGSPKLRLGMVSVTHILAGLAAGIIVSTLFFSSFFSNPGGILDSVRTYVTYFNRAGGSNIHDHPWYYYLKMLIYFRYGGGPIWTEGLIVLLAAVGFIAAMLKKGPASANIQLLRFIAFYTLILTVIYSAVPYKTPWCVLGFLHGMILLAGVGAVVLVKLVPNVLPRLIILCLLFDASAHLAWQAYRCNYIYDADSRNPYVYAHPTKEVFAVVERVEEMAGAMQKMALENPDKVKMHIQVICPGKDYWPLPWYFRRFEKDVIGWWDQMDENFLFSVELEFESDLDSVSISEKLRREFEENKTTLSLHVTVSVEQAGRTWLITDKLKEYYVREEEGRLNIYDVSEPLPLLIIASPEVEAELTNKLYNLTPLEDRQMYLFLFDKPYYMWLRPKIKLLGFVRKDLWNFFYQQQTDAAIEKSK